MRAAKLDNNICQYHRATIAAIIIASRTFRMCWAVSELPGFMMPGQMFTVGSAAVLAVVMEWNVEEETCCCDEHTTQPEERKLTQTPGLRVTCVLLAGIADINTRKHGIQHDGNRHVTIVIFAIATWREYRTGAAQQLAPAHGVEDKRQGAPAAASAAAVQCGERWECSSVIRLRFVCTSHAVA